MTSPYMRNAVAKLPTSKPPMAVVPIDHKEKVLCEHVLANKRVVSWQKALKGQKPMRCDRVSTVKINGGYYCRQHAGGIVLDDMIERSYND